VVVGLPHELLGEMVVAAVEPADERPDALPALKRYARGTMSAAMQPRLYQFVGSLPLTPNGKPDVPAVRSMLAAQFANPL
jgi:long-chain acyl-CoA synthetase